MMQQELVYLAGLFDGEGCIHIGKQKPSRTNKWPAHCLYVMVNMTDPIGPICFYKVAGGSLKQIKSPIQNRKPQWAWRITGVRAARFLRGVMQYLKIKRDQAILAIEFQESVTSRKKKQLDVEEIARRDRYYKAMMNLKKNPIGLGEVSAVMNKPHQMRLLESS